MESETFKEQREAILANSKAAQEEMLRTVADRLKGMAARAVDLDLATLLLQTARQAHCCWNHPTMSDPIVG